MKVCMLMAGDEEGGLEQHFVELANGICQHLDLVVIAHQKYKNRFNKNIIFEAVDLTKNRKSPIKLFQLSKIINKHKPALVHAHANKAASMLASIRHFISSKTIATIHNQKKRIKMFNKMDHVIGVSHAVLQNISNPNKTKIYNGVVVEQLKRYQQLAKSDFKISSNRPLAISVGRLVKAKGMDVLINAWKDIEADLLIVGDGPDREALEKLCGDLAVTKRIQFLGHRNDVGAIINLADIVIIASRREGFSYVCAEALLLNTPVISTDVPVANEILPVQYVVEIESVGALNKVINNAISDLAIINNRFHAVFETAQTEFTFEYMMNKTIECYKDCVGQK